MEGDMDKWVQFNYQVSESANEYTARHDGKQIGSVVVGIMVLLEVLRAAIAIIGILRPARGDKNLMLAKVCVNLGGIAWRLTSDLDLPLESLQSPGDRAVFNLPDTTLLDDTTGE